MNYTLNQLQIFLKIVETKSITKAAELLFLSQPAVSIQLKNLQNQFEIPLTEIIGRQLYVTPFGEEIADASRRIITEVDAMKHKTMVYKGFLAGQLNIAIVSTGKYVMPYFLSGFLQQHEGIDLKMDVTNRFKVLKSIEQNEVDFALVSVMPDNLQVENIPLMLNKLYLVGNVKRAERFLKDGSIDMANLPLIYREKGSATRRSMENFLSKHHIDVTKKMQLTSNEAVKQAVIAGLGFSVMPLIGIKSELLNNELKIIPINGLPVTTFWNLIWLKGKKFTPAAKAYLDYLKTQKEDLISQNFQWHEDYEL
ncbi:LysR family transcriptional regulator [Gelidibacter salicanalis]|uniref:LysR family transcriptional regulator n=1 Tax=Gelidibacter salicanalis TaxID=291193 RepID=A0A934KP84_9FLAO|nr:LysR family transcriptional regulator [Gelidibacter salicanalis]MBJ7880929.1 LysR family transcriptional regulator [Gelidibacter salicanalis]